MTKGLLGHFKNGQVKNVRNCYVKKRRGKRSKSKDVDKLPRDDVELEVVAELTLEQRLAANLKAARARGEVIVID